MHEQQLVVNVNGVLSVIERAGNKTVRRVTLALSPDAQMDEAALRLHWDQFVAGTPLETVDIVVKSIPAHLHCPACLGEFERAPGLFTCPTCGHDARPSAFTTGLQIESVEFA